MPWGTNLSVFYDHDQNFKADAPRYNLFGDTVANPLGHTKEYGFTINTLNDKVSLKVDWYNTQVANVTLSLIHISPPIGRSTTNGSFRRLY